MFKPIFYIIIFIILSIENGLASDSVIRFLDSKSEDYAAMSKTIWSLVELGYQEKEIVNVLRESGNSEIPFESRLKKALSLLTPLR